MDLSGLLALLNLSLDLACLGGATYAAIAGTTKPNLPAKEKVEDAPSSSGKSSAKPNDFISSLGLTKIERLVHVFLALAALWHVRALTFHAVPLHAWITSGDRGRFRLACMLAMIGGAGRIWTYKELGHYFTFDLQVQKGQKIIDTGPYAYVRHPSYTAILVCMSGISLAIGPYGPGVPQVFRLPLMGVVGAAVVGTVLLIRKRCDDEERMFLLDEATGKPYFEYMKKVGQRLWPNVY